MKTIGLIGGMSWESTVTYYQVINEFIKEKLGGFHSAKCLLISQKDTEAPLFDTTLIHGKRAAMYAVCK